MKKRELLPQGGGVGGGREWPRASQFHERGKKETSRLKEEVAQAGLGSGEDMQNAEFYRNVLFNTGCIQMLLQDRRRRRRVHGSRPLDGTAIGTQGPASQSLRLYLHPRTEACAAELRPFRYWRRHLTRHPPCAARAPAVRGPQDDGGGGWVVIPENRA